MTSNNLAVIALILGVACILALMPLPYAYYSLLRLAIMIGCGYLAYAVYKQELISNSWVWALAATAVIFNPIAPIHLGREGWMVVDLIVGVALLVLGYRLRRIE